MIQLEGAVERITYLSEADGYTVAKLRLKSGRLITAVGKLPLLYIGEKLALSGEWVRHKEYGPQFQVLEWKSETPKTLIGIERFLSSSLIKGVGPVTARKIVERFGLASLEVIENSPERLTEISGLSLNKAEKIAASLKEYGAIQKIMVFLRGLEIGPGLALKIYHVYREEAARVVTENPYRLADQVIGVGFKTADQIARKIGISPDSPYRIRAGIRFLLNENSADGHIFADETKLLQTAVRELAVSESPILAELEELLLKKEIFREEVDGRKMLYLASFYYSEIGAVSRLRELIGSGSAPLEIDADYHLEKFCEQNKLILAQRQEEAVFKSLANGILVITGGPGTGKTTIIKAILYLFRKAGLRTLLAAPTGRAAKRLAEATGVAAKTIHRLLGFSGEAAFGNHFQYNEDEPLDGEVLIVDEFSMVDLILFYNLLKALKPGTRLIVVGDVDQLPSVGPGSVLRDLLSSGKIPAVRLDVIFRQARESLIIENAHRINKGEYPILSRKQDFFFIPESDPEKVVKLLPELVKDRIPEYLGCDPIEDIQVLAPMRRTITGVENLNLCLQTALNPPAVEKTEIVVGNTNFRIGDKVMQIKNNYQKSVFNGDIGRIRAIDPEEKIMMVGFPEVEGEKSVEYETEELDQLVLSYAISVHKSQGNEYPVIIMPITTQHYMMLQRNLLYTAVTRAKKMAVLIGTKKAIMIAINNNRIEERNSLLRWRIEAALP